MIKTPFIDIHTHHPVNSEEIHSVPSLFLQDIASPEDVNFPFSAAVHPWHAEKFEIAEIRGMLEKLITNKNLIAIGETGLDKGCRAGYQRQKELFELQLGFAEENRKPLIIHAVKSWNDLLYYIKRLKVPCILHGYSEGVTLTKELIDLGCYFSLGGSLLRSSPRILEAIQIIPLTSLFLETDDSGKSIIEIYHAASKITQLPLETLKIQIYKNFTDLFPGYIQTEYFKD